MEPVITTATPDVWFVTWALEVEDGTILKMPFFPSKESAEQATQGLKGFKVVQVSVVISKLDFKDGEALTTVDGK